MTKLSIYDIITNKIIESLEKGRIPWKQYWKSGLPCNYVSGKEYSGLNLIFLSIKDYSSPYWLTWNQIKQLGGSVKKGEKSSIVTFWKITKFEIEKKDAEKDEKAVKEVPFLRYYNVWNWEQTDGIKEKKQKDNTKIDNCEDIIKNIKEEIIIKNGDYPCYIPSTDTINMLDIKNFTDSQEYYSTLFHELTHWTGHEKRLNREGIKKIAFGSECYSKEELIAELGSAFICARLGVDNSKTVKNQTAYIQGWLTKLNNDKKFIINASSKAQKAVNYIFNDQKL